MFTARRSKAGYFSYTIPVTCGNAGNRHGDFSFSACVIDIITKGENTMETVQPIRDLEILNKCYEIARDHDRHRKTGEVSWELLLMVGFNTSLRVSDFRRFRVEDLKGKDYALIKAKKTGKEARILINPSARREINRLLTGRKGDEYIFQSRQQDTATHKRRPITRQRCYQIINTIAREAGIQDRIGCHTLRKTFGYHYYQMTHDVVSLQRILCHSYQRETLVYIGVVDENIDESLMKFNLLAGKRMKKEA